MTALRPQTGSGTDDPRIKAPNQPPLLAGIDLFEINLPLAEALDREGASKWRDQAHEVGRLAGQPEILELGFLANENPPRIKTFDRFGNRTDEVEYHPAYHQLMEVACGKGFHSIPWTEGPGGHAARGALFMTWSQVEAGHGCPISMTYAAVPALKASPDISDRWLPLLTRNSYDQRSLPAEEKTGAIAGMAMTEKQGGSDVRANLTTATPTGSPADHWLLDGHKWFCSAPMSDLLLVLAQTDEGLGCFAVSRFTEDGARNNVRLQRLKDKLGNRSNASGEIEFHQAEAHLVGDPGRGVQTIVEMVNHTRLDCVLGSAAGMRWALALASHHAAHRSAFGRLLSEQPLMQAVLADLALESEAATILAMRLARAYDSTDPKEASFRRIATAVGKYWVCKRQPMMVAEALEVLGGNGYVEESGLPRLYREAPLNGVWEGSGNVICLDVLRAASREEGTLDALLTEIRLGADALPELDLIAEELAAALTADDAERNARVTVERLAIALQASLVARYSPQYVADAFVASRMRGEGGFTFGALPTGIDAKRLTQRATPSLA